MRFQSALLALTLSSILVMPAFSAAQAQSGPILNELELKQALSGTSGPDHAKLEAHFNAMADRYAASAARHEAMAKKYPAGPPQKGIGSDLHGHCLSLAKHDKRIEAAARQLAKMHASAAPGQGHPGKVKGMPKDMGARKASDDELAAFAEKAGASGDHVALAEYFTKLAERYSSDAATHQAMATMYRTGRTAGMADHCERLAREARAAADEAKIAASQHASMKSNR